MKTGIAARASKVVLVALLFLARAAHADWWSMHHLEIPAPWTPAPGQLPPPPISKVRIMLVTSGVPGGTIIIDSDTTTIQLTVPAVGSTSSWPPPPQPSGVDRVSVTTLARAVVIDLEPNSMLDVSKCQNISGPKTYILTWNGANVEGTRLTSYYGVNTGPATSPNCGLCSVRANQYALQASWREPILKLGRNPMDVVLVLDKSGSMGEFLPTSQVPKWEALKSSVNAFIDSWKIEPGPSAYSGLEEDRLAMVLFDTFTHTRSDDNSGLPFFVARGNDATGSAWNTFTDYLVPFVPSGATAMGQGLGIAYMNRDSQPNTAFLRDTTFLLVTDGLQNVAPMIQGLDQNTDLTLLVGGTTRVLKNQCVPIHTVSVGAPPTAERLLNAISAQTVGQYGQAMSPDLDDLNGFTSTLKDALGGYSVVDTVRGQVGVSPFMPVAPARGVESVTADRVVNTLNVELDSSIRSALIFLQWVPFTEGSAPMDLRVRSPYGIVQPSARTDGAGYMIARLDLPSAGPTGTWSFDVMAGAVSTQTSYQLTVLANEMSLGLETRVAGTHHFTGEPLTISTFVGLDGVPVEGKAKLEAMLTRPAAAFGTILHNAQIPNPAHNASSDPRSQYEEKVRAVLADPVLREKALKKEKKEKLKFKHVGHGIYELTLDSVDVPGTYRFDITLEIPMPRGERIRRIDSVATVVAVSPTDPNVRVKPLGEGRYDIHAAPRDAFGQYAGPGKKLVATVSRGQVARVIDPQVRGEYVVELVDVTGNPTLTLTLEGTPLGSKPLSQWDSTPQIRWDGRPQIKPSPRFLPAGDRLRRTKMPIQRGSQWPGQRRKIR